MSGSGQVDTTIGWVGVGKMGEPMATGLLARGARLRAFDLDSAAVERVAAAGAHAAGSVAELAAGSDIVVSMVSNDRALLAVAGEAIPAMRRGGTFCDMSTVSPGASAEVAELAARHGMSYLRAPVSGSTALAKAGTLTVLASGDRAAWDVLEPLFPAFSSRSFYLGDGDQARYMKLVLNTMVGGTAALLGDALRLGEKGGLGMAEMLEVIGKSAVASPLIAYKTDALVAGDFSPAFSLDQMVKDMSLIEAAADARGCRIDTVAAILTQYRAASGAGFGDKDFFALMEWQRQGDKPG